jgi:hypothetical protein
MKMTVLWDVAPCSLVEVYWCFKGAYCLHHQGDQSSLIALMVEAVSTAETSVIFYQTTLPEDSHLRYLPSYEIKR